MAAPVVIVKENPGTLSIEVLGNNGKQVAYINLPEVKFRIAGSKMKGADTPQNGEYRLEFEEGGEGGA